MFCFLQGFEKQRSPNTKLTFLHGDLNRPTRIRLLLWFFLETNYQWSVQAEVFASRRRVFRATRFRSERVQNPVFFSSGARRQMGR